MLQVSNVSIVIQYNQGISYMNNNFLFTNLLSGMITGFVSLQISTYEIFLFLKKKSQRFEHLITYKFIEVADFF